MGGSEPGQVRWIGKRRNPALIGMTVLIFLVALAARPAHAATLTVDRADDSTVQNCTSTANDCSLRGAISAANSGATGPDTIDFAPGISTVTLTATGTHENNNADGDLDITDDLTIDGGSGVTIEGTTGWSERILDIIGGASVATRTDVTITDATIRNGNATVGGIESSKGGGIQVNGNATVIGGASLTLQQSTVTDNTAVGIGGGIYDAGGSSITLQDSTVSNNTAGNNINGGGGGIFSSGTVTLTNSEVTGNEGVGLGGGIHFGSFAGSPTLTMTDSTVSGNTVANAGGFTNGGGIYFFGSTMTATINDSTVSGNTAASGSQATSAGQGGGIYADSGTITLSNSTVSGNTAENGSQLDADGDGGGVYVLGAATLTLANATIASNTAGGPGTGGAGGGVFGAPGSTTILRNTIVAANSADVAANFGAAPTSQGYNLFGENPGGIAATDKVNSNPLLGPLANNGGPTRTHALLSGSPAIDAGNPATPGGGAPACAATDQRGATRPQDGDGNGTARCDIGAFEKGSGGGGTVRAMTIGDVRLKEGNRGFKNAVFTVRLDAAPGGQVTVNYATANGSAKAPSDYTATSGTLTFDQQTETISVPVRGDRRNERNEAFFVNLSSVSNATLADRQGRATIVDND